MVDDGTDYLRIVNRFSGVNHVVGFTNVVDIEAIAAKIGGGGALYAVDAGQLGILDRLTGNFNPMPNPIGSGNGDDGVIAFTDVDGLIYDPFTDVLYGSHRRTGIKDVLIQIDTATGQVITSAFAGGKDYVLIDGFGLYNDCDDLAIDPADGQMYGISNDGGINDDLISIDKTTGVSTVIASIGVDDVEGLGITTDGLFYATTGDKIGMPTDDQFFQINKSTGAATYIGSFFPNADVESCDCILGALEGIILSVDLAHFTAQLDGNAVRLDWGTSSEINNDFYTIARRSDDNNFEELLVVPSEGNHDFYSDYVQYDENPLPGVSYYRLTQTDFNGKTTHLGTRQIELPALVMPEVKGYPNPNDGQSYHLDFEEVLKDVEIMITSNSGQVVYHQKRSGFNQKTMAIEFDSKLSSGIYLVDISTQNATFHQKLVVK